MERREQGEQLNIGKDLSPAEHHFFLGSSTSFKNQIVNTETLPELEQDPDFLQFFLRPQFITDTATQQQIDELNQRRKKGFSPQFPLFVPQSRWREFMGFKSKIIPPAYHPDRPLELPKWTIELFNSQGEPANLERIAAIKSEDPYFLVNIEPNTNCLVASLVPNPTI